MRRQSRDSFKIMLYLGGSILGIAIITFVITFLAMRK